MTARVFSNETDVISAPYSAVLPGRAAHAGLCTAGEPLSYGQILFDSAVDYFLANEFESARIHPEGNTSVKILSGVIEMQSRLDGNFAEAPAINGKFAKINQRCA